MCVCPLDYAKEIPLQEVPQTHRPRLSTATGKPITVYGRRIIKFKLDHQLCLTVGFWVCDVQHPLISVRSLMKSNLRLVFGSDHCYICKPGTDKLVTLVEQGPLFYLPTKGRTDNNNPPATSTNQPQQPTSQSSTTTAHFDKT